VAREPKRGVHRKRLERRPLPGMMLHIDGSRHQWFQDHRWHDLIVVSDDATSEVYYARLVEEESTPTVMAALQHVVQTRGVFCTLYSDRGSHFWQTPKAGGKVDPQQLTQVGRALRELGIQMIPAYSPQARGRCERAFATWQGRLPQELRLQGIDGLGQANEYLREVYIGQFNVGFQVPAAERGTAFTARPRKHLELIFSLQSERVVKRDNTVEFENLALQIEPVKRRRTLAASTVTVHRHLDQTLSLTLGPLQLGRYTAEGVRIEALKPGPAAKDAVAG
jgi:transposase InsO family protein